ncbi:MAG: hypothetical protein NC122_05040 [Faecalibacterium sp.]|nr:hypothetical protein [Ruminococcus sp.]MCM1391873.1 hypothetical protein [Ruminococcus sp.]MCM1485551.1 hypothetical protein [Faecalibacterium sp.]
MSEKPLFNKETTEVIIKSLKKGNTVELKKENGHLTVIEIERKKKIKQTFTTG